MHEPERSGVRRFLVAAIGGIAIAATAAGLALGSHQKSLKRSAGVVSAAERSREGRGSLALDSASSYCPIPPRGSSIHANTGPGKDTLLLGGQSTLSDSEKPALCEGAGNSKIRLPSAAR